MLSRRPYGFGGDKNGSNIDKAVDYILFNDPRYTNEKDDDTLDRQDDDLEDMLFDGLDNDMDEVIIDDVFEGDMYHDLLEGGDAD